MSLLSINLSAQLPSTYCDGNPADWAGFPTNSNIPIKSYTLDIANASDPIDDNYKQAKDVNDISTWKWWLKGANDKGDITNAGAMLTGTNNCILRFFGDRTDNSGSCNIGFWFLKNDVDKSSDGSSFTAGHAIGDVLVLVELNVGGTLAAPKVYEWTATGLALVSGLNSNTACAGANPGVTGTDPLSNPVPAGFTYTNKDGDNQYLKNAFFEGAIDLCGLNLSTCFATFIVETRQSPSTTAALEDFAVGDFNATPAAPTPVNNSRCGPGNVTLTPTGCSGGTIQWYTAATGGTAFTTGSPKTFNLSATTDYYISCKVGTCESPRVKITATIKSVPAAPSVSETFVCDAATFSVTVSSVIQGSQYNIADKCTNAITGVKVNGNTVSLPYTAPNTNNIVFSNIPAGSGYIVTVTNSDNCNATTSCGTCPAATTSIQSTDRAEVVETVNARIPSLTKVLAVPNPFNDRIKFNLESAISGQGTLELYNILGQKVKVVYQGYIEKGKVQTIEYVVPNAQRSSLIYLFRVGDQRVTGKLLGLK